MTEAVDKSITRNLLPIPNAIIPPGIDVNTAGDRVSIVFSPDFDEQFRQGALYWDVWRNRISEFFNYRFPVETKKLEIMTDNPIVDAYARYLGVRFLVIRTIVESQQKAFKRGDWDLADEMNQRGGSFSIPDILDELTPEQFFAEYTAKRLVKFHPEFHVIDDVILKDAEANALQVKALSADSVILEVDNDRLDIVRKSEANRKLQQGLKTRLLPKDGSELLALACSEEDKLRRVLPDLLEPV